MSTELLAQRESQRPSPQAPMFQFSLGRILLAITVAAIAVGLGLTRWGGVGGWFLLGFIVLVALFVDTAFYYVQFGNQALAAGKHDRAVLWYSRAIRVEPSNPDYWYVRGVAYQSAGNDDFARDDFLQAIRLKSNHTYALAAYASVCYLHGELDAALHATTIALIADPNHREALLLRGAVYVSKGDFAAALDDFEHGVETYPDDAELCAWRGTVRFESRQYAAALTDFQHAAELGFDTRAQIATAQFRLGAYADAFERMEKLLAEAPATPDILTMSAVFLACCPDDSRRDGRRAFALASRARDQQPSADWATHAAFAAAYAELRQFPQAIEHGELALAAAPLMRQEDCRSRLATYRNQQPYRLQPPMM